MEYEIVYDGWIYTVWVSEYLPEIDACEEHPWGGRAEVYYEVLGCQPERVDSDAELMVSYDKLTDLVVREVEKYFNGV